MFENGFDPARVQFESRKDFGLVKRELYDGTLADVYILDNEVYGEYGGEYALRIHDKATELGRSVIVVTLLCSSIEAAKREYGSKLDARQIPILDKLQHAPPCGFWVASCLDNGQFVSWEEYLRKEGITLEAPFFRYSDSTDVQEGMLGMIRDGKPGAFYQHPIEWVTQNREGITQFMSPGAIRLLDKRFPSPLSGTERI